MKSVAAKDQEASLLRARRPRLARTPDPPQSQRGYRTALSIPALFQLARGIVRWHGCACVPCYGGPGRAPPENGSVLPPSPAREGQRQHSELRRGCAGAAGADGAAPARAAGLWLLRGASLPMRRLCLSHTAGGALRLALVVLGARTGCRVSAVSLGAAGPSMRRGRVCGGAEYAARCFLSHSRGNAVCSGWVW